MNIASPGTGSMGLSPFCIINTPLKTTEKGVLLPPYGQAVRKNQKEPQVLCVDDITKPRPARMEELLPQDESPSFSIRI